MSMSRTPESRPEQSTANAKRASTPSALPEPGERQQRSTSEARDRHKDRRGQVSVHPGEVEGQMRILGAPHSDLEGWEMRLRNAFGTASLDFAQAEFVRVLIANGTKSDDVVPQLFNGALAAIDGVRPRNEIEAMLAGQMVVTHTLALELLGRARAATHIPQADAAGNLAIKLLRTFTAQTEALAKLRRGVEQTVRVEHVHVHSGGQAVVGNVAHHPKLEDGGG
jgi:hypothetical protein